MIWQDAVIAAAQWVFIIALLPVLRGRTKPPKGFCLITSMTLFVCAATNATLDLWISAATVALLATLWLKLAAQQGSTEVTLEWLAHWFRVFTFRPAFKGGTPMIVFVFRQWRYSFMRLIGLA